MFATNLVSSSRFELLTDGHKRGKQECVAFDSTAIFGASVFDNIRVGHQSAHALHASHEEMHHLCLLLFVKIRKVTANRLIIELLSLQG